MSIFFKEKKQEFSSKYTSGGYLYIYKNKTSCFTIYQLDLKPPPALDMKGFVPEKNDFTSLN